jgi:hypothetical protein
VGSDDLSGDRNADWDLDTLGDGDTLGDWDTDRDSDTARDGHSAAGLDGDTPALPLHVLLAPGGGNHRRSSDSGNSSLSDRSGLANKSSDEELRISLSISLGLSLTFGDPETERADKTLTR